jgi:deoxycytidylate deaminase
MQLLSAQALENVFNESSDFLIIGLTGRTGSGCSTCANILAEEKIYLPEAGKSHYVGNEQRKFRIIKKYINKHWNPFQWLRVTSIITRYILAKDYQSFIDFIEAKLQKKISNTDEDFKNRYDENFGKVKYFNDLSENTIQQLEFKKEIAYELYFAILPDFSKLIKDFLNKVDLGAYTKIYQIAGDNIRASGSVYEEDFKPEKILSFAKNIHKIIISALFVARKNNKKCYIVIDAIRNPYEAIFLKQRHSEFYLVSINTENENRLAHLRNSHKISEQQIKELDKKEYPSKLEKFDRYVSQNIQKCIEISDIHINNPRTDNFGHNELRCQLAWYVSLMLHSGLVMPTSMESCMQIAYSVKKNSGCISRQVGAVVTDNTYAVKSVGWNNTAQGQVPCLLRNVEDLLYGFDEDAYSYYEKNDSKFREALNHKYIPILKLDNLKGRNLPFCFKDVQNEVENEKNQVHTRSLHAEENAFLQISKFGGQALLGGVLFTTASPCELCAKKAYQLGISQVYYIDPYPGIATNHILKIGKNAPELILYRGAVGSAFDKLYQPILPYKDELDLLFSIPKYKNEKKIIEDEKTEKMKILERENEELKKIICELKQGLGQ